MCNEHVVFSNAAYEAHEYRHERKRKHLIVIVVALSGLLIFSNILWAVAFCGAKINNSNSEHTIAINQKQQIMLCDYTNNTPTAENKDTMCDKTKKHKKGGTSE